MGRSWYRFSLHGSQIVAPLAAEQVANLQARGVEIEPASKPGDIAERLAPVLRLVFGPHLSIFAG